MAHIIVIGASSGGLQGLMELVKTLPEDLPAALFVVVHIAPTAKSRLPEILSRSGPLKVLHPDGHNLAIESGTIYVAPPDKHLLIENGFVKLSSGPRENRFRPSIDTLFRSAAHHYGPHVVGVLLSGSLDDGVAGLIMIKNTGGTTIVQDPSDATYPNLPLNAIKAGAVDQVLSVGQIAAKIIELTREEKAMNTTDKPVEQTELEGDLDSMGKRSLWKCPDCGGVLWEIREGELFRYQCHVGHRYSELSLLESESDDSEIALWNALRALKEKALLARTLADRAERRGESKLVPIFAEQADDAEKSIETLSQILYSSPRRREEESQDLD